MPTTLVQWTVEDRLKTARRVRFVGRHHELEEFAAALKGPESPFAVLFVQGRAGVGKTALLRVFSELASGSRASVVAVDGKDLHASPAGFMSACGFESAGSRAPCPTDGEGRLVILVDSYEQLAGLDDWFREEFVLRLPAQVLVVVASRNPPSSGWYEDPGWRDLLRVVRLANLSQKDAHAYLEASGVPVDLCEELADCTHGHPLALAAAVDLRGRPGDTMTLSPDLVRVWLDRLVEDEPTAAHRLALEACAVARTTTHEQLRVVLGRDDVNDVFDWLRGLSFISEGPDGLVPHDVARDLLTADLRLRDPGRLRLLVLTLLGAAGRQLQSPTSARWPEALPRQVILDLLFTFRQDLELRDYWDFNHLTELRPEPALPSDKAAIVRIIESDGGRTSAALAERWFALQPEGFRVTRAASGAVDNVVCWLRLHDAASEDVSADPVTRVLWAHVGRHRPPLAGEFVTALRFGGSMGSAQQRRRTANLASFEAIWRVVSQPNLSWDFQVAPDPQFWAPLLDQVGYRRVLEADMKISGRLFGAFAHDWREIPRRWSYFLDESKRRLAASRCGVAIVDLPKADFAEAVRQALRNLHRPDLLARNPLLHSRLVADSGSSAGPSEVLTTLLTEAVESLSVHPRDEKLRRVAERTYLRPAPTQEKAAELLGLPSSTYRRHLTHAVQRITDKLWDRQSTEIATEPAAPERHGEAH